MSSLCTDVSHDVVQQLTTDTPPSCLFATAVQSADFGGFCRYVSALQRA